MTRFTVVWDKEVESQFLNTWIAGHAGTRAFLTDVANLVDSSLSDDPIEKGIRLSERDAYILVVPVSGVSARVSVTFQVLPNDQLVRVIRLTIRGE